MITSGLQSWDYWRIFLLFYGGEKTNLLQTYISTEYYILNKKEFKLNRE